MPPIMRYDLFSCVSNGHGVVEHNCFILMQMNTKLRADILPLVSILKWTNANNKSSIAISLIEGGMVLLDATGFNYNR